MLPLPHRRLVPPGGGAAARPWLKRLELENAAPLGLAAAMGLGVLLGIVWWPLGALVMSTWRGGCT